MTSKLILRVWKELIFPDVISKILLKEKKKNIEADIEKDFSHAYEGIVKLPLKARLGVYVAYKYYLSLFTKIRRLQAEHIMEERIRIPNYGKMVILAKAGFRSQFNLL